MKRFLLTLFIASAALLAFNSCTKEYYEEARTITFQYTINPGDWDGQGTNLLFVPIDVNELTDDYVDFGVVNLSVSFDNRQTFTKLPATVDGVSYFYDYTTGAVDIWAQDPIDDDLAIQIENTLHFKVSLTEGW